MDPIPDNFELYIPQPCGLVVAIVKRENKSEIVRETTTWEISGDLAILMFAVLGFLVGLGVGRILW